MMPETLNIVGDYRTVGNMGEGTFSEVLKCQSLLDGKLYACKKMKQKYSNMTQVNNLREVQALRRLNPHPNVISLKEVLFDKQTGHLSLICELMDMNVYELIKDRRSYLPEAKVKLYMYQLCKALYHMHRNGIFHRDVKPENILIKDDLLKLADFGSCKSMHSKLPFTEYISTRWYRAPECLLTDGHYGYKMDMWSVGCVLFELMSLRPLFPGSNELDQISKIHDIIGTPSPQLLDKFRKIQSRSMEFNFPYRHPTGISPLIKHASRQCVDLITKLCIYDPEERISAKDALRHPFFRDLRDAERRAKLRLTTEAMPSDLSMRQPSHQRHMKQYRLKQKDDLQHQQSSVLATHHPRLVAIKPKQYYMPSLHIPGGPAHSTTSGPLVLPQIPTKPLHMRDSHHMGGGGGLVTGLPSLSHSMKASAHVSAFPSLLGSSSNASGKSSTLYPSARHHHHPHHHTIPSQVNQQTTHLPSLSKSYYAQRTNF